MNRERLHPKNWHRATKVAAVVAVAVAGTLTGLTSSNVVGRCPASSGPLIGPGIANACPTPTVPAPPQPPAPPPTPGTANIWVSPTGTASPCPRSATLVQPPSDPASACGATTVTVAQAAYTAASPGDKIGFMCGDYPIQLIKKLSHVQTGPQIIFDGGGVPSTYGISSACARIVDTSTTLAGRSLVLGDIVNHGSVQDTAPSFVTIQNFEIDGYILLAQNNGNSNGTNISLLHNWVHHNNEPSGCTGLPCTTGFNGPPIINIKPGLTNVVIRGNNIGPACCNGDLIGLGCTVVAQAWPVGQCTHQAVIDNNYIHDMQDSYNPATWPNTDVAFPNPSENVGLGFGNGCGGCDHADGLQAFGGEDLTVTSNLWYNAGQQHIFLQAAICNGTSGPGGTNGCFTGTLTITNNLDGGHSSGNSCSLAGPGNGTFSGTVRILYNSFARGCVIYNSDPCQTGGTTHCRVLAPGTVLIIVGNIVNSATFASPGATGCGYTASDGSIITPTLAANYYTASSSWTSCPGNTGGVTVNYVNNSSGLAVDEHLVNNGQVAITGGEATFCPPTDVDLHPRPGPNGICTAGGHEVN